MNLQQYVLDNLKDLTVDKQKEVLDFIKFLKFQQEKTPPVRKSLRGLWTNFDFSITEEDISQIRKEMGETW